MAVKAKLSVLGLYRWNPKVFKEMAIPSEVDGDVLTWKILEDCAELEILYSDPEYMQASIYNWSSAMLPNWQKMVNALTAEYNPIWNKDGTVKETYHFGAITQSENGTGSGSATDRVAGFNSDSTHTREESETGSTTASNSRQEEHTDTVERVEQGNIGVTESSAMVRHEMELRADFNIYEIIANDFKRHYCLMVY